MLGKRLLKSLPVLIVIAVSLTLTTIAPLVGNVVIQSVGTITPYVIAKSGSPADIQAAVNTVAAQAKGTGTVIVPAGRWNWTNPSTTSLSSNTELSTTVITIPVGVNVIGTGLAGCSDHTSNWTAYTPQTIIDLVSPAPPNTPSTLFWVDGKGYSSSLSTRISGIAFIEPAPSTLSDSSEGGMAIQVYEGQNCRIDHCSFYNFSGIAVNFMCNDADNPSACTYGIIDHCIINDNYKLVPGNSYQWGYGFYANGNGRYTWGNWDNKTTDFLGKYCAIPACALMYVEDCHMSYCRHATDAMGEAWNVVRFDLIDNTQYPGYGAMCLHGTGNPTPAYGSNYGGRGEEVYNLTVYASDNQDLGGIRLRGGSAMVYNNRVIYSFNSSSNCLMCLDNYDQDTTYPYTNINQTYIWSNTNINCTLLNVLQGTQNVNYFLRAPTLAQDGFTYTPYPYPNPRTLQP
jgi:hypothetical protein